MPETDPVVSVSEEPAETAVTEPPPAPAPPVDAELLSAFQSALIEFQRAHAARLAADSAVAEAVSAQVDAQAAEQAAKTAADAAGEQLIASIKAEEP